MSKRTRNADNSKRQQPVQQQRAQARQPDRSSPASAGDNPKSESTGQPAKPGKRKP